MEDAGGVDEVNVSSREISLPSLETEVGKVAANSIRKASKRINGDVVIPDHEQLYVGDVILRSNRGKPKPNVEGHQRSHGRSEEASKWTHAMLYIGNLHVLESHPPTIRDMTNGVRVSPLMDKDDQKSEYLILRCKLAGFNERRFPMVRRALLHNELSPQKYDIRVTIDVFLFQLFSRRRTPDHDQFANCSEYVLSCYANGAETLVEDYIRIRREDEQHFFFPADLYTSSAFDHHAMAFSRLAR